MVHIIGTVIILNSENAWSVSELFMRGRVVERSHIPARPRPAPLANRFDLVPTPVPVKMEKALHRHLEIPMTAQLTLTIGHRGKKAIQTLIREPLLPRVITPQILRTLDLPIINRK